MIYTEVTFSFSSGEMCAHVCVCVCVCVCVYLKNSSRCFHKEAQYI